MKLAVGSGNLPLSVTQLVNVMAIPLNKPFSSDVEQCLKDHSDAYCFVAFSGHGCDGSVVLNDHRDNFPVGELKPKGKQGTLIIDSCRGVSEAINFSFDAKLAFANESGHAVALNARHGRSVIFASSSELSKRLRLMQEGVVNQLHLAPLGLNTVCVEWVKMQRIRAVFI